MNIMEFIQAAKIVPDIKRDQYFLLDSYVLDREAEMLKLNEKDVVLEIGAGFGSLTIRLAKKCKVLAVEPDEKLCMFLRKIENVVAMQNDVIKILEEARKDKRFGAFNKVAGNIPYSKSQEIILELLRHPWETAVLCVQKEFAEKLLDKKEKLSMLIQDCCSIEIKEIVKKEKFYPQAVDSAVILLKQKKQMDEELWKFLQRLFKNRNKNVSNIIKNAPQEIAKKKVHMLTLSEIKKLMKHEKDFS